MSKQLLYLRSDVMMEPLFNRWYAWPHLIPPATAGMNVANLHQKVLQSFVLNPQFHMSAVKNPAMVGGPFVNYDASRVPDVKALMQQTESRAAPLLSLAAALKELDKLLQESHEGMSLQALYPRVPEPLQGYVELVYDLHHRPSYRLLEGLLYRSPYYLEALQSVVLSPVTGDSRPFVLSTPRLEAEGACELPLPFRHEGLDLLFRMKQVPDSYERIQDVLRVEDRDGRLRALMTEQPPRPCTAYGGEGVRVRYFGHACVLIQTRAVSILVDPVVSYSEVGGVPRYTYSDLPESIDYVLITHGHQDHLMFEPLLQLRHKVKTFVVPRSNGGSLEDPSPRLLLRALGFRNVVELDELESIELEGGAITAVPFLGEHGDLNIRAKTAFHIALGGKRLLFAADSNNLSPSLYDRVREALGPVDILFMGMECEGAPMSWLYGALLGKPLPRKADQSRRLNGSDSQAAAGIIERLQPREVYIYAMGQEPWLGHIMGLRYTETSPQMVESNKVLEACRSRGIRAERPFGRQEWVLG